MENNILCSFCSNNFTEISQLIFHLKNNHNKKTNDTFPCKQNFCNQSFNNINSFKKHLKLKHVYNRNNLKPTVDISTPSNTHKDHIEEKSAVNSESNVNTQLLVNQYSLDSDEMPNEGLSNNTNTNIDIPSSTKFLLALHNKNNFTRKDVTFIQKLVNDLVNNKSDNQTDADSNILKKSEYMFFKHLVEKDIFELPTYHTINDQISEVNLKGIPTLANEKIKSVIMPMSFQLKKYLEIKGSMDVIKNHLSEINNSSCIKSFLNCELWQKKQLMFPGSIVLPIYLYFDDFGINNPLGSHAASVCGAYYSIGSFPNYVLSKLDHIFLASIFKSSDAKVFGNTKTLYPLVQQLKNLEENGIEITIDGKIQQIYFSLALVLGDNLGLNSVLGFTKSFQTTHFCRTCKRSKEQTQKDVCEYSEKIRNRQNYKEDLLITSKELRLRQTGIEENSIFNELNTFHVTENFVFDIMHDFFEGICRYNLIEIFDEFINKKKYFTLETFNYRKQNFPYGEINIKYKGEPIQYDNSKNGSFKIKTSSIEMITLIHFLPLMIGDLVPQNDKVWNFFLIFLDIIEKVFQSEFTETDLIILETLIKKHNETYLILFKKNLKPKYHFLLHYIGCIKKSGPLKYLWSMRYEAKHQEIKKYAKNVPSRRDILYSIAIKQCLKFSKFITDNNAFEFITNFNVNTKTKTKIEYKKYYRNIIESDIDSAIKEFIFSNKCNYKGTILKKGYLLFIKKKII